MQSTAGFNGNTIFNAGTNGNVGIGNFNPAYKLDLSGDERVSGKMLIHRIVPLPGDSEIHFGDSSIAFVPGFNRMYATGGPYHGLAIGSATFSGGLFSTSIGHYLATGSSATSAVVIGSGLTQSYLTNTIPNSLMIGFNSDVPTLFVSASTGIGTTGDVGIGMSSPQYKLDVCGTIRAKEVRVNTTGCDFVFDSAYVLMPLDSLDKFVQKNKHLPNIPTAVQMETADGVALGQLNSLYLEKIEEQTLYTIELQKEIIEMQKEIEELKKK
jgi:hypothetical protein